MRVIAGKFKGYNLKGNLRLDIRPTTDRVKESLFNIIGSRIKGASFADLFSGYGNVGIEAISRSADYVMFIDNNRKCINILKENISSLITKGYDNKRIDYKILCQDVFRFFTLAREREYKFDIIFMDPPYRGDLIEKCLFKISRYDILKNSGMVIAETLSKKVVPESIEELIKFREQIYGNTKLLFFKWK